HQLVWQWNSDPFGTTATNENPSTLGTFTYNLRFPGQYFDAETGTHYNYFRDYEAGTGRYLEFDPLAPVPVEPIAHTTLAGVTFNGAGQHLAATLVALLPYGYSGTGFGYVSGNPLYGFDISGLGGHRPSWGKNPPINVFNRQGGACHACGQPLSGNPNHGKPRNWDLHHADYMWSELRNAADELACLMPNNAYSRKFINRMKSGMFRDTSNLKGLCKPCHRKAHK
ncbi:MAG: hypothetical protein L0H70_06585, partial [Xanthomonadales bacterium]|nr:hypothetical protein [Xanthomonadales bacterium]